MKTWSLSVSVLSICAAALQLVACGGSQPLVTSAPVTATTRTTHNVLAVSYRILHSFGSGHDGAIPTGRLLNMNGTLYGVTDGDVPYNRGTVYSITLGGKEKVLYIFTGLLSDPDGALPVGGVIDVHGTLYGATFTGGEPSSYGTVYSITTTGKETVLHTFHLSSHDGSYPDGRLLNVKGTLYGTTQRGGRHYRLCRSYSYGPPGCGTVDSITTTGTENVLYSFSSGDDGELPSSGLLNVKGTLYGTTLLGGSSCAGSDPKCGTVYSITTTGAEKVLHSFGSGSDGNAPSGDLLNVNGTLYGTTQLGGIYGYGTVFSISTSGSEHVLYSFRSGSDGAGPGSGLIDVKGVLYGTTGSGGRKGCRRHGCGTIYSISTTGAETVLHHFGSGSDGSGPGPLLNVNGTLYGVTGGGGAYKRGTVFSLTP